MALGILIQKCKLGLTVKMVMYFCVIGYARQSSLYTFLRDICYLNLSLYHLLAITWDQSIYYQLNKSEAVQVYYNLPPHILGR